MHFIAVRIGAAEIVRRTRRTAMNVMRRPVLQLNASYEALRITSARRALNLVTKEKAVVELATNRMIYPGIYLPSVIRLVVYKHVFVRMQVTTRRNIFMRDSHHCQYCGQRFQASEFTLDHIIPRAQGAGRQEFLGEPGDDPGLGRGFNCSLKLRA
jgi:hypothetical protein